MSARRAAPLLALAAALPLVLARCTVFDGLSADPPDAGPAEAATPDAPATSEAGGGCRVLPPSPPSTFVGGDESSFVVVIRSVAFGAPDAGAAPEIGFDLDGLCSCPEAESCVASRTTPACDLPGGRDNEALKLFRAFVALRGIDLSARANESVATGTHAVLLRVERYNGRDDDSEVTVSAYGSRGLVQPDGAGGITTPVPPKLTAEDRWSVSKSSVIDEVQLASAQSAVGYVRGRKLVVAMDVTLGVSSDFRIPIGGGVLVADVVGGPGAYRLSDAVIAGRWSLTDAVTSLGKLRDQDGTYFCEKRADVTYQAVKSTVCRSADLTKSPKSDRTGAPCDAISIAVGFDTAPASLGVVVPDPPPTPCDALPPDPCN
ncbi:MAG: hypothetical protein JNL38_21780 [Myxococcales bacterium]|jgi:hypothetical protein|nr:hypothetical protein [Myxococcales bacterium]